MTTKDLTPPLGSIAVDNANGDQLLGYRVTLTSDLVASNLGQGSIGIGLKVPGSAGGTNPSLTQAAWFINPTTGSDNASGGIGAPLKTVNELTKRFGVGQKLAPPGGVVAVKLLGDMPASDSLALRMLALGGQNGGVGLQIKGPTPTVLHAGQLTNVVALNRASNTPWQIEDLSLPTADAWSGFIMCRLVITSGPNAGARSLVALDMGARVARTGPWEIPPAPGGQIVTLVTPLVGDNYEVQQLGKLYLDEVNLYGDFSQAFPYCSFEDVWVQGQGGATLVPIAGSVDTFFYDCRIDCQLVSLNTLQNTFCGCALSGSLFPQGGFTSVSAGVVYDGGGEFNVFAGGICSLDADVLFQGVPLIASNGHLQVGTCGVFDSRPINPQSPRGAGLSIGEGFEGRGSASLSTIGYGTHALYGSGNVGPGLAVGPGGLFMYEANLPSVTGTEGDFTVGDSSQARAWDEAGSAFTPLRNCTWANMAAAIGAGGFGGNCQNVQRGGRISKGRY